MEPIEKIERLRENADVSFEEAREALEESNWDLLDAVVYLEDQGKTVSPINSTKSTNTEEIPPLPSVKKVVEDNKQTYETEEQMPEKLKKLARKFLNFIRFNSMKVTRSGEEMFRMPLFVLLILFLVSWKISLITMIGALFFNVRYSFVGKHDLDKANKAMEKVGEVADKVQDEFRKL